jgi:5,5'-dehydrodivanillate O-demethylase
MLSVEMNERLTRVGAGTPMGELMRRYWHPIAAVPELNRTSPTKAVRLLGEDLTLYQDRSGTYGLIDDRCPHRRMNMEYGITEEHGLWCAYHGWLFDETGQCEETPAEAPDSTFKERVKAYPVEALGGLIFAYLGPQPVLLLPRWEWLVDDHA